MMIDIDSQVESATVELFFRWTHVDYRPALLLRLKEAHADQRAFRSDALGLTLPMRVASVDEVISTYGECTATVRAVTLS